MIPIYFDMETIPTTRADIRARCVADVSPPGNYKKPESIAQWWASEGEAKKADAIARTALDGTWGEIICIGLAVDDGPVQVITRETTEADLLDSFGLLLSRHCTDRVASGSIWEPLSVWIGHNIIDFDLRFLWQRSKLCGHRFPFTLPIGRTDHNGPRVYDTMKEWAGYRDRVSQSDLELAFGIERIDPLPNGGADVFEAYSQGRIDDIVEHCRQDVTNLREIYRRMAA